MEQKPSQALTNQVQDDRLALLKSRLSVAKAWCKKPHESMKKWIKEYNIENFDDLAEIRDKVRIGYIFRKTESEIATVFDDQPEIFIKGRTKDFQVVEDIYNSAYDLLWDKQNLEEKIEDVAIYFALLGMGFLTSPYLVKTKKVKELMYTPVLDPQTGQPQLGPNMLPLTKTEVKEYAVPTYDMPDAQVKDPFKIYFSPETIFNTVLDSEHCPYYIEEMVWTKEKIKARFGKDVDANEKIHTGDDEADGTIEENYEKGTDTVSDDLKRATVYLYYGTLPEAMAKGVKDDNGLPVDWEYDKEYEVYFTKNEELQIKECPYATKPLFILGNYGMANKFWKFGDAKHLMPLIQELEAYRSLILTHTRKIVNPKLLVEEGMQIDEDALRDPRSGRIVKYHNVSGQKPEWLQGGNLGQEVGVGIENARTDLEKTAGSFDLENGQSQSQVRTPRGIQVFSDAADRASRRKRKKVARFIRELIVFQFQQLALNWKPEDNQFLEIQGVEEPVTAEVLQVLGDSQLLDKVDIEVESLSTNKVQMKQDALDLLDTALKSEGFRPGILNLELIWRDTLQNGFHKRDADRYINPEEQQQQIMAMGMKPKVAVRINADSDTPAAIQMLQNDNLINQDQANVDLEHQVITQAADHQANQQQTALQVNQQQAQQQQQQQQLQSQNQQAQAQQAQQQAEMQQKAQLQQQAQMGHIPPIPMKGGQ